MASSISSGMAGNQRLGLYRHLKKGRGGMFSNPNSETVFTHSLLTPLQSELPDKGRSHSIVSTPPNTQSANTQSGELEKAAG